MTVSIPAKECLQLIQKLQQRLNLAHVRVDVSATKPSNGALFEIISNRNRNHHSIRVSEKGWNHPERERLLKHELLHIVLDPIREEHDFQMEALQSERQREYSERLLREIEKAVEHLSYVL